MNIIKPVSKHIVFHSWLKDEKSKLEQTDRLNELINNPDFDNVRDNDERFNLLMIFRSKVIREQLINAEWYEIEVIIDDLSRIYHCPTIEDWGKISNTFYQPSQTITNVFPESKIAIDRADKIKAIYGSIGDQNFMNGLILIGSQKDSPFTVIEGNHRFTAFYYLLKDKPSQSLFAKGYLGVHPDMNNYDFHIGKYM
jgi:hypothetical protein